MPVLLIIKFVVSIIFYLFLILLLIEVIKVRLLNKQLNGIKDENEKDKTSKKIKRGKNMIKFFVYYKCHYIRLFEIKSCFCQYD